MFRVSPTRMNLLGLRQQTRVAQKGLDLLESKRQALVGEFFNMVASAIEARGELREGMRQAQNGLTVAIALLGREKMKSVAMACRRHLPVELVERNVWGVRFPDLRYQSAVRALDARGYAITGTPPHLDETARRFEEVVDCVLRTVSVEMKLKRVGEEIRKMTRRINALNERILPALRRNIREIKYSLEEREHEDIYRMKRFRKKR